MSSQALKTFFAAPSTLRDAMSNILSGRNPLGALEAILPIIGIPCTMSGELNTIIEFNNAPLSYTLRITGDHSTSTVRVIKDHENVSHERNIRSETDLQNLCVEILTVLAEKEAESVSGSFRPRPLRDADLLGMLQCQDGLFGHEKFREAARMVARGHLLDAVVELATPFGLQPERIDGSFVRFQGACLKSGETPGLRVHRFSQFGSETSAPIVNDGEEAMPLDLGKCVVMGFVKVHNAEQEKVDQERHIGPMLRRAGYISDLDDDDRRLSPKSLLYDLSKPEDVLAMVERILLMRNSQRELKMPFEMSKWLGKQENQARIPESYPDPLRRPRAYACWWRQNGDKRNQVTDDGGMEWVLGTPLKGSLRQAVLILEQEKVDAILIAEAEERWEKEGIGRISEAEG